MATTVLTLIGSLRADSLNRKLADAAAHHAPEGLELTTFEGLGDVPFYNEDIDVEGQVPAAASRLREAVAAADAVLLVSPEYNGTMPAVLKNAIDWLSRPFGASALSGKPAAVIGAAFSASGGSHAAAEAHKALGISGARVLEDVVIAIPGAGSRFAQTHPKDDAEVAEQLVEALAVIKGATEPELVSA